VIESPAPGAEQGHSVSGSLGMFAAATAEISLFEARMQRFSGTTPPTPAEPASTEPVEMPAAFAEIDALSDAEKLRRFS
jgi:hypothetical protein